MKKVKIIGVPEHFNLPWHMAIADQMFTDRGIDLQWTDIPEGTGRMCQMLNDQETDLAIILTEGIVKSISEGNKTKIVQEFIGTPLQWGIHVHAESRYQKITDLEGTKAAISRYGSGSHLISYVNAVYQNWNLDQLQFEVVHNLEGAVNALTKGVADYFLWEHFTTKPLVDQGVFKRLGNCPTPWPCFVIAASSKFIAENRLLLNHIQEIINQYTLEFKQIPSIDKTLAIRYQQKLADITEWLSITEWSQNQISVDKIKLVNDQLYDLGRITNKLPYTEIVI